MSMFCKYTYDYLKGKNFSELSHILCCTKPATESQLSNFSTGLFVNLGTCKASAN